MDGEENEKASVRSRFDRQGDHQLPSQPAARVGGDMKRRSLFVDRFEGVLRAVLPAAMIVGLIAAIFLPWGGN